jgi:hypothetical protein
MPPVFDGAGDPGMEFTRKSCIATPMRNAAAAAVATLFGQSFDEALPRLRPVTIAAEVMHGRCLSYDGQVIS